MILKKIESEFRIVNINYLFLECFYILVFALIIRDCIDIYYTGTLYKSYKFLNNRKKNK